MAFGAMHNTEQGRETTRFSTDGASARHSVRPSLCFWRLFGGCSLVVAVCLGLMLLGAGFLFSALGSLAAGGVMAWVLAQRRTMVLQRLCESADAVSDGDYSRRITCEDNDDFSAPAAAFNQMVARLGERIATLERDHGEILAVLSGMVEGVIAVDTAQCIVHMNATAAGMFDVDTEASIGRPLWEVVRNTALVSAGERALGEGTPCKVQTRLGIGRAETAIDIHAAPIRREAGDVAGVVLVLHDVSDLRRLERIRQDFVANVSHELKTPLAAIQGMVETMVDNPDMDEATRQRFTQRVLAQGKRLTAIVNDLLALSMLESDERTTKARGRFSATEVLRDVIQLHETAAAKRKLSLEVQIPQASLEMTGSPEELRLIASNLLDNAIKYTPEGGALSVKLTHTDTQAVLEVKDTGPGIAHEHIDRIFERFYRIDKARSRELGGTGLGLSIAKHAAAALGGDLTVQSQLGKGTTFRARLPLAVA